MLAPSLEIERLSRVFVCDPCFHQAFAAVLDLRASGREVRGRAAAYIGCNSKAIAIPVASARNDSSVITGTGGHGFSPPFMRITGAACGALSMPASAWPAAAAAVIGRTVIMPCFK